MIFNIAILVLMVILKLSKCSMIIDSQSQNTLYVSHYCPKMKYCAEGAHVMCMYYDHNRPMGQHCRNYVKVDLTREMMEQILDNVNEIRSRLAIGKETGKNGHRLPRAYGMMKLFWDSELATLAQVLANQCLGLREDLCRATDKFPRPSQIITLVNFKVPHWDYLSRNTTVRGLTREKISFAIDKALKSLHAVKKYVGDDIITDCPPLGLLPDVGSRSYLKLISGHATHIGCGISAYMRYHGLDSSENIYNSVQIVCNISDGPQAQNPIYTTEPPVLGTGFTEQCGCPRGYRETRGCLCEEDTHHLGGSVMIPRHEHHERAGNNEEVQRLPHVINKHTNAPTCADGDGNCALIYDIQDNPLSSYETDNDIELQYHRSNKTYPAIAKSYIQIDGSIEDNEISDEKYKEIPSTSKFKYNKIENAPYRKPYSNEPRRKSQKNHDALTSEEIKMLSDFKYTSEEVDPIEHIQPLRRNNDQQEKLNVNDVYEEKDNDNTFLSLLDILERAVQNIELDGEEKEIFDIKMRKIYESVINTRRSNAKNSKPIVTHKAVEIEDIQEPPDYVRQKTFRDDRVQERPHWPKDSNINKPQYNGKDINAVYDFVEPQVASFERTNGIDDRLINIINRRSMDDDEFENIKHINQNYINHDVYNNIDSNIDQKHKDIREGYSPLPLSRKQEKIAKYIHHNFKGKSSENRSEKKSSILSKFGYTNNKMYNAKTMTEKSMRAINVEKLGKTIARRPHFGPEEHYKKVYHSPSYRRTLETAHERPVVSPKPAPKVHTMDPRKIRYHMSNRPIIHKNTLKS